MIFGLLDLSLKHYVITTLVLTQITIACVTLYLHRCETHQALKFHPVVSHFFRFWLWLTTGIKTKEWVAIHRKHHAKCETVEDPHSPVNWGLKTMLFKGMLVYRAGKTKETLDTYGYGTPNDWIEKNLYSRHDKGGIILMLLIDLLLFGLPGLLVWVIQMVWIPFWACGIINGVGHVYGYRNFETNDASTNVVPWGLFIGGEELHNNHHAFPSSAKLSVKWWEIDIGWFYIQVLQFFKLAKVKRSLSLLSQKKSQSDIDFNLVKLMINNRLQVMTNYSKQVILPAWTKEYKNNAIDSHLIPEDSQKFLVCSEYFLDEKKKQTVSMILEKNAVINLVYQFKISLQQIWDNNKSSQEELLGALKNWIEEARKSGNLLLEKFANSIPHYTLN
jgi:stearoyl-CoA desaturase (delta-9 desaturase)